MTERERIGIYFEIEFKNWVNYYRLLMSNRKGIPMKMNDTHLRAVARAQHFVQSGITGSMQPRHKQQIENDIALLSEIHTYIRQQIIEPGLPMQPESIGQGNNGDKHGDNS